MSAIPTTPKGRRTRNQILQAARKVLARSEYVGLHMSDAAAQAAVSMGALYRCFEDKEDLFVYLMGDMHEEPFKASQAGNRDFVTAPYDSLLEANRGYLMRRR